MLVRMCGSQHLWIRSLPPYMSCRLVVIMEEWLSSSQRKTYAVGMILSPPKHILQCSCSYVENVLYREAGLDAAASFDGEG